MCPHCGNTISIIDFSLADFLSLNNKLFVIMGVFGALAIYLHQIAPTKPSEIPGLFTFLGIEINSIDFAIASSLVLLLIISLLILYRLFSFGTRDIFEPTIGNVIRIIFIFFFAGFIYGVISYIAKTPQYYESIHFVALIIGPFAGIFLFFGLLEILARITKRVGLYYLTIFILFLILFVPMGYFMVNQNFLLVFILLSFEAVSFMFLILMPIVLLGSRFYTKIKLLF